VRHKANKMQSADRHTGTDSVVVPGDGVEAR